MISTDIVDCMSYCAYIHGCMHASGHSFTLSGNVIKIGDPVVGMETGLNPAI